MVENKKYFHPGVFIRDGIEALDITAEQFAIRSGLSGKDVSLLINERKEINLGIAQKISSVIGGDPLTWMKMQNLYDLYKLELKKKSEKEAQRRVARLFDSRAMKSIGLERKKETIDEKTERLCQKFKINDLNALRDKNFYSCCYHNSQRIEETEEQIIMQNAWINCVVFASQKNEMKTNVDLDKLKSACAYLRTLSRDPQELFLSSIKETLSECGVNIVYAPYMPLSNISGFTKWTKNRDNVILGISDNGKRVDKFFFTLFHEIKHILNGDKRYVQLTLSDTEVEADDFAGDCLIDSSEYKKFIESWNHTLSQIDSFAQNQNIDISIVLGRMAHDGYIKHSNCSKYYRKFYIQ